MNILIENAESMEFFTGDGRWSKKASDGRLYGGTSLAFRAAKQEPVGKFNIVGYFPDSRQFINLDHGRGKGSTEAAA
jgi:hypothetical protein